MRDGDISNSPEGSVLYVVWEGLIAVPTERHTATRFRRRLRFRSPARALELYRTNEAAVRQIWALWEHEQRISVVTFLGNRVAEALAERLAADVIPYVSLISTTAGHLASPVATDPGVLQVIGPAPRHRRTYGSTRRHLPPRDAALIGRRL